MTQFYYKGQVKVILGSIWWRPRS